MNTRTHLSIVRRTVALALIGVTVTAAADQIENRTASDCVAVTGTVAARSDGGLENTGASTATVMCPVDRRAPAGTFSTYLKGRIWAVDQNASSNVCCTVVSVDPSNGSTIASAPACSAGSSASAQMFDTAEINSPYTFAHYFVRCDIPGVSGSARSRIQTVRNTQR